MSAALSVKTERVDDLPLLLAQLQKMQLGQTLDEHVVRHGNRQGLSAGELLMVWLVFILSEGDHRLNQLEGWAEQHQETLSACLGKEVQASDCHIARLGWLLEKLSEDSVWESYEGALNRRIVRVYDLESEVVRLDMSSASYYGESDGQGLLRFGYSKDGRGDLPQVKLSLAALDPLGMPLATLVVEGNKADDPLYLPTIARIRQSLGRSGLLYVGDSKLGSLANRAGIAAKGDCYLCPLSAVQVPEAQLLSYLQPYLERAKAKNCSLWELRGLCPVQDEDEQGEQQTLGYAFEVSETQALSTLAGETCEWQERRILSYSLSYAHAQQARLEARLQTAEAKLSALLESKKGKRLPQSREELDAAIQGLLEKYHVHDLLKVQVEEKREERTVRAYRGRVARSDVCVSFTLRLARDEEAITQRKYSLGWRVLATNQGAETLPLTQVPLVYRQQPRIESGFARLKGRSLALTPLFLQRDDHIKGLINLLSLALRVLTLTEFVVREVLQKTQQALQGVYAGQPKRSSMRPRTETLLASFKGITLSIIELGEQTMRHLSELSPPQQRILELLGFPSSIYQRLATALTENSLSISESL